MSDHIPKQAESMVFPFTEQTIFDPKKTTSMSNRGSVFSESNQACSASGKSQFFNSFGNIFLSIFLPTITFDATPQLSFEDLRFFLNLNLSSAEQKVLHSFLTFYDLENVRSWILQTPMTVRGGIPHEMLKDNLNDGETGIPVVDAFLKKFPTQEDRVHNLPTLSKLYIKTASQTGHPFLQKYFFLENRIRRILSTFRAETSVPPFQLTSEELSSSQYHALYKIWKKRAHSYDIEREISIWKFLEIERLGEESPPLSFDRILSYLIRLLLVESRLAMKEQIFIKNLERLVKEPVAKLRASGVRSADEGDGRVFDESNSRSAIGEEKTWADPSRPIAQSADMSFATGSKVTQ